MTNEAFTANLPFRSIPEEKAAFEAKCAALRPMALDPATVLRMLIARWIEETSQAPLFEEDKQGGDMFKKSPATAREIVRIAPSLLAAFDERRKGLDVDLSRTQLVRYLRNRFVRNPKI